MGKTTLVQQVVEAAGIPAQFASADEPTLRGPEWIAQQWEAAQLMADPRGSVLVLDEAQKIGGWSETVKRLWDEDTRQRRPIKVVVLGSAPLLISRGLSESLAGRFEVLYLPHWSAQEMHAAFGWSAEKSIFYGGYPGAAALVEDPGRWVRYVRDALIETTHRPRCAVAHPRGQAGVAAPPVRSRLPLFGADPFLYQDGRPASGCGQHNHARALPRSAGRRGHAGRAAQVCRCRGAQSRLEPEVAGA